MWRKVILLLAGISVILVPLPAAGSNWFGATSYVGCNNGNITDNSNLEYQRLSLTTKMQAAVSYAITNAVNPTDLNGVEIASATSVTDAVIMDSDYSAYCNKDWHPDDPGDADSSYVVGLSECKALNGGRCDRSEIRFDTSRTNEITVTDARARKLACHEIGHSIGLKHGLASSQTCMTDAPLGQDGETVYFTTYSSHEIVDHINPTF
jgi:hypothetical protein